MIHIILNPIPHTKLTYHCADRAVRTSYESLDCKVSAIISYLSLVARLPVNSLRWGQQGEGEEEEFGLIAQLLYNN